MRNHRHKQIEAPEAPDTRLVGYARVSTAEQSLAMQIEALERAGCMPVNIHTEKVSGVASNRPGLELAMLDARKGDTLVVWKLDRVGRSLRDLLNKLDELEKRGIGFRSLTEGIDTTTPGGRLIMHVMGALAQFERDLIVERTKAGVRAHIARGGRMGAPKKLDKNDVAELKRLRKSGMTWPDLAKKFKVSTFTVQRYVKN